MDYFLHIAILFMLYLLLVQSMNMYLGYTGILALCHIAFYGIGAYTSALISLHYNQFFGDPDLGIKREYASMLISLNYGNFWLGFFAGGILAAALAFLLGIVCMRLKADYLGIATLGFSQIILSVFQNWMSVTRGPLGLTGIKRPEIFGLVLSEKLHYFLFVAAITAILMFLMYRIIKSPFGRVLEMVRDDEVAARALGKNTLSYKLIAFSLGAFIAALAGSLDAHFIQYIDPNSFHINQLSIILVMTVLGGLGTFRGPFLGVFVILFLSEGVTFIKGIPATYVGSTQLLLYSLIFLIVMIYFPQGLGGFWKTGKRRSKQFTKY
jgi:branched-chain amino acid transport system permease protein